MHVNPEVRRLALIRVGGAIAIPEVLRDLGADAHSIIRAAGLSPQVFDDPENTIPVQALGRLLAESVAATRCGYFGLLVGQREAASSLGLIGLLAENSPNVRTALNNLVRYLHLHDGKGVPILEIAKGSALFGYTILDVSIPSADQIVDGSVAIAFNIMRRLCGKAWRPIEVRLPRAKPGDTRPYFNFFETPVTFGAEHGALVLAADWLAQPVTDANPLIRSLLEDRIQELDAQFDGGLPERLRRLVRTLIVTRRCSLEVVAHLFNMAPRTFSRRLDQENIVFRTIVDELRYEVARHLLADTLFSMTEIAASLDYSESSAFTRAFRRWSGRAPAKWRSEYAVDRNSAPHAIGIATLNRVRVPRADWARAAGATPKSNAA